MAGMTARKVVEIDQFSAREVLDTAMSEHEFQAAVIELAHLRGWLVFHSYDSRRDPAGFPDLVMVRGHRIMFVELKTERGRVRPQQREWLDALSCTKAEVWLWRPSNWPQIEEALA
jgi:Holliday junction resolvase-like predicted endonuclease